MLKSILPFFLMVVAVMTPRAGRCRWVGAALAVAAGLSLAAPHAAADCATHLPHFGGPLPFDAGPVMAHKEPVRNPEPSPRHCPCHGPNCRRVPADPAPAPTAPPSTSPSHDVAWCEAAAPLSLSASRVRADGDTLLAPLFFPSPLERPPR